MQVSTPAILKSKKFLAAALAAVLSFFCFRHGMTVEQIAMVTGPLLVFIGAQGLADHGKEREKAKNGNGPTAPKP